MLALPNLGFSRCSRIDEGATTRHIIKQVAVMDGVVSFTQVQSSETSA
jgi:hypothetical protein